MAGLKRLAVCGSYIIEEALYNIIGEGFSRGALSLIPGLYQDTDLSILDYLTVISCNQLLF